MKRPVIQPSHRKLASLHTLTAIGLKPSDGYDYLLHERIVPGVSLKQVRRELSSIKISLAEELIRAREHNLS